MKSGRWSNEHHRVGFARARGQSLQAAAANASTKLDRSAGCGAGRVGPNESDPDRGIHRDLWWPRGLLGDRKILFHRPGRGHRFGPTSNSVAIEFDDPIRQRRAWLGFMAERER